MLKYIFLAVFLILMFAVSWFCARKVKNLDDFLLGGRRVGPWLSALAYGTTYFSAVIFVGYAGKLGWNFGMGAVWIGIGNAVIGTYLAWKVMARRTRAITRRLNVTTMPEFLEKRYLSKPMKVVCAVIIFIFLTPYCASVYQGLGMIIEETFGVSYQVAILIMTLVTAIYIVVGGYIANAMTSFVQGIFMIVGVTLMVALFFGKLGGVGSAVAQLAAISPEKATVFGPDPLGLFWLVMLTSLGVWGLPQMVHKFYAIEDGKSAIRRGTVISTVFAFIVGGIAYLLGAFGPVVLNNTLPEAGYDAVIPTMINATMPDAIMGLIVVVLLAASMSTLASLVMSSSSAIAIDLIRGAIRPKISEKNTTLAMRLLIVLFLAISVVIALFRPAAIVNLMGFSWGTVAGACIGPFVLGVLWKRATRAGAWAGVIVPLLITLVMSLMPQFGIANSPMIGVISMLASLLCTAVVSLLTQPMTREHLDTIYGTAPASK